MWIYGKFPNTVRGQSRRAGKTCGRWSAIQLSWLFLQGLLLIILTLYCTYIMSYIFQLFKWLLACLKHNFSGRNLFFIYLIYSPFVRLTFQHTKIHHSIIYIYFTIYLFIYILAWNLRQWKFCGGCVGRKKVSERLEPITIYVNLSWSSLIYRQESVWGFCKQNHYFLFILLHLYLLIYTQYTYMFNLKSVILLERLQLESDTLLPLVEIEHRADFSSGSWECNIVLAMCECRCTLVNSYMLDQLPLAFVDCHCKGKAVWELMACQDKGKATLMWV